MPRHEHHCQSLGGPTMGYRAVFFVSAFSFLFSWLFGWEAIQFGPAASAIVPAALAFTIIGAVGGIVGLAIRDQDRRLRALEQRPADGKRA